MAELQRKLRRIDAEYPKRIKAIHEQVAKPVESMARRRAPVRSGRLKNSVRSSGTQRAAVVRAGTNVKRYRYAGVIHFGWPERNIRAQPFMTEAIEVAAPMVVRTYEKELVGFVQGIWGGSA